MNILEISTEKYNELQNFLNTWFIDDEETPLSFWGEKMPKRDTEIIEYCLDCGFEFATYDQWKSMEKTLGSEIPYSTLETIRTTCKDWMDILEKIL